MKAAIVPLSRLGVVNVQQDFFKVIRETFNLIKMGEECFQLRNSLKVFTNRFPEGHIYSAGDLLLKTTDENLHNLEQSGCIIHHIESLPEEGNMVSLRWPGKIALYAGLNSVAFCSEPFPPLFQLLGLEFTEVNDDEIRDGGLDHFECLIVPGGPDAGESYYEGFGDRGLEAIKTFVRSGGYYIGVCAGAYLPLLRPPGLDLPVSLEIVEVWDSSGLDYWRTGAGFVRLRFKKEIHPVVYGLALNDPSTLDMVYWEGPVFECKSGVKVIATFDSFLAGGMDKPSWDVSCNQKAVDAIEWYNPLTPARFDKYMKDKPAIIEASYGDGTLLLFSPHPEFGTPGIAEKWENSMTFRFYVNAFHYLFSQQS
ncbi:MAG: BPL-N domain-containing protein [Bacillota bacterium]|nr:BPL-N domain-containing protein [Bacillota bacterium]